LRDRYCPFFSTVTSTVRGIRVYSTDAHCTYVTDDTQARDNLARMATSTVLDARRRWIRSTGPARHITGRSSAPLRSHRVRISIAHRACAALARTLTTFGGGVDSLPGGERHQLLRDLWSGALHEVAEFALAVRWVRSRCALVPRRARAQRTDAAWQRSNANRSQR
jgi:hypothetical protein